jgi:hypothetical protein
MGRNEEERIRKLAKKDCEKRRKERKETRNNERLKVLRGKYDQCDIV